MSHAFPRAHALVRAAAWSDGGAEFIFSDGTVFSFVDHMNSFVAVRADAAAGKENSNEREMCFTAWTLSSNAEKVRAALAVYNSLSEHPRLFSTLLSTRDQFVSPTPSQQQLRFMSRCATDTEGCGVWREPGPPIHTLLLEKRSDLFRRYTVYGSVREWLVTSEAPNAPETSAAKSIHDAGEESGVDTTIFSLHDLQQEKRSLTQENAPAPDKCDVLAKAAGSLPHCVPVGTVLELWCALRRVRLTVAPHRATFTVRWPVPVTRPDGSRLPRSVTPVGVSSAHHAAAAATTTPLLFTYVEQTFPVQDPPPAWRVMLALALELDAEVPDVDREESCSGSGGAGASRDMMRREPDARSPRAPPSFTHTLIDIADTNCQWLGRLPDPHHWGGTLNNSRIAHPCRFSALTAAQATHLAAPRTTRVLATMRALHSSDVAGDAQLCWLYEADGVGPSSSPAVYWCLASAAPPLPGVDVLAWVAEDGSAVRVRLEGKGYTVLHERVAAVVSRPAIYRLSAEGAGTAGQRLPPTTAPLRCRVCLSYTSESTESAESQGESACAGGVAVDNGGGGQPHEQSIETRVVDSSSPASAGVALVDAASLFCAAENGERRPASSISVCASLAMLISQTHAVNRFQSSASLPAAAPMLRDVRHNDRYRAAGSMSAQDARALRSGRYLASVVDVAVQLSQVNCAACRSSCSNALSSTCPSPLQQRNVNTVYSAKAPADADAVAAARTEGLVCLTSHLDGIGTFTALTNGTVRGHFADRAIVFLIPGANELDEAQLLATCILRDARRCSIHVAQCRPSHPVFRYLAYMLPFRRYVYLRLSGEIGEQTWCGDASAPSSLHSQQQNEERRWERCVSEAGRHTDASCVAGLSLVADSAHLLPSLQSSGMVEMEQTAAVPSNSRWGITDSCRTAQSQREREAAVFAEHASRLQEMLEEQDSLSHATRALLRD